MAQRTGFTIVELLIVIVVIGILASVAVVSYVNQARNADNLAIITNTRSYKDSLIIYQTLHGSYPNTGTFGVCLGTGYPDRNNDGLADCGANSNPADMRYESTTLNEALSPIRGGVLNVVSTKEVPQLWGLPGSTWVGAVFVTWDAFTVNGVVHEHYLAYALYGNATNCGDPDVVESDNDNGGFPNMKPSTTGYTWTDGTSTECFIPLPLP